MAETNGRLVLRLANADILPFDFAAFGDVSGAYVDELVALPGIREAIEDGRFEEAEEQIQVMAEVLGAFAAEVARATAVID